MYVKLALLAGFCARLRAARLYARLCTRSRLSSFCCLWGACVRSLRRTCFCAACAGGLTFCGFRPLRTCFRARLHFACRHVFFTLLCSIFTCYTDSMRLKKLFIPDRFKFGLKSATLYFFARPAYRVVRGTRKKINCCAGFTQIWNGPVNREKPCLPARKRNFAPFAHI